MLYFILFNYYSINDELSGFEIEYFFVVFGDESFAY